jgi:nucleoside-diphosphate-sugar epimerase
MKVLLIGGTGHVGSRLAAHLGENSIQCAIATRHPQSVQSWLPGIDIVETSDIQQTNWKTILQEFTHVVHLVSPQERDCNQFPDEARRVVEHGSVKLGEAVRHTGCHLIYLSTTQVYGPQPTGLITEESPTLPANTYADVHLRAEEILRDLCHSSLTIARLANSVGLPANPGLSTWHLLVHDLAHEAAQHRTMTLRSSGFQHRSFVAMSEVVSALTILLNGGFKGSTTNIANPTSMSVRSMAKFVREQFMSAFGKEAEIRFPTESDRQIENPFEIHCEAIVNAGLSLGRSESLKDEIIRIIDHVGASK